MHDVGQDDEGHHYVANGPKGRIHDLSGRDNEKNTDEKYRSREHVKHLSERGNEEIKAGDYRKAAKTALETATAATALAAKEVGWGVQSGVEQTSEAIEYEIYTGKKLVSEAVQHPVKFGTGIAKGTVEGWLNQSGTTLIDRPQTSDAEALGYDIGIVIGLNLPSVTR